MRVYPHLASLAAAALAVALSPLPAHAEEVQATFSSSSAPPEASVDAEEDVFAPRGNLWELGIFGGLLFLSNRGDFRHDSPATSSTFPNFDQPSPEVGLRLAYFPLAFLGLEVEGMAAAARTNLDDGVTVWGARGHLILQVPTSRVTLFALGGGGRIGVVSDVAGNDHDPELHFGGGLKIALHPKVSLRFDIRDNITSSRPGADTPHHIEGLGAVALVFGRPKEKPQDSDRDGVIDLQDQCPIEPGPAPTGCPIRDRDADGIADATDQCPFEPGPGPSGCPVRDADGDGVPDPQDECASMPGIAPTGCPDGDGDGILDRDDKCPNVKGVAPDGCPADSDGDGIVDDKDRCPDQPETRNGFEDDDGCPDQIPEKAKKFNGVIKGIEFDTGKAAIRPTSARPLDDAANVLNEYPSLRVSVVGHTDSSGARQLNLDLSQRRADAVKAYLVSRGVDAERIETRGAGPDEPLDDNKTFAGRQRNRRIEFQILMSERK